MEDTVLFYGFYKATHLTVDLDIVKDYFSTYNLPLAYLVVTGIYFIVSLLLMVRQ